MSLNLQLLTFILLDPPGLLHSHETAVIIESFNYYFTHFIK